MRIHHGLEKLPKFENSVLTIGSFDGVHGGHKEIMNVLRTHAEEILGESVLITFYPHPRQVLYKEDRKLKLLNTIEEKTKLIAESGIDHMVLIDFTIEFSQQRPLDYIENFLVKYFQPKKIIIGYDHRFGLNREGDVNLLRMTENQFGFKVVEIPQESIDEIGISSTKIRKALNNSNVKKASKLLGYYYNLKGKVVHGNKIGQGLGFPTANIELTEEKIIPQNGVYAVVIKHREKVFSGMAYIGKRSVIGGQKLAFEVHIFKFDGDLYDTVLDIYFVDFIREDRHFESLKKLKKQLKIDHKAVSKRLSKKVKNSVWFL